MNGKLAFDDTLDIFFPEYEYGKNITVENLLLMQSGIPDYINDMDQFFQDATDDEMMKIQGDSYTDEEFILQLSKNELLFEPGSDVMYSNTNYHLLALIIEQVTGKTYSEYISSMIFEPCEMTTLLMSNSRRCYWKVRISEYNALFYPAKFCKRMHGYA